MELSIMSILKRNNSVCNDVCDRLFFGIYILCRVVQIIVAFYMINKFNDIIELTSDDKITFWLGVTGPIEFIFEYTVIKVYLQIFSHETSGWSVIIIFVITYCSKVISATYIYITVLLMILLRINLVRRHIYIYLQL